MILKIWLREVPEYTIIFVRLVLLLSLCDSFTTLLGTAKGATGKIKIYQITLTAIGLFHLPFSALFFYLGYPPYYAMYVYLVIILILQLFRIFFVCNSIGLSKKSIFQTSDVKMWSRFSNFYVFASLHTLYWYTVFG